MKKIIIISSIVILSVVLIGGVLLDIGRTPDTILRMAVKGGFRINMEEISPTVTHFEEEWYPNGDGYCLIEFKYKEGDYTAFFEQFNRLPIEGKPLYGRVVDPYRNLQEGYYMIKRDIEGSDIFEILLIDPKERNGVLYYEVL